MKRRAPLCPLCDADLVLSGEEEPGDGVFCSYCGSPVKLPKHPDRDDEATLDEEF